MAKFNQNVSGKGPKGKTVNYEGGEAFRLDDEQTFVQMVSSCMMGEPKFYGEPGETESKIMELAQKLDPQFVLQVAAYTRSELYLRSVPIFLLAIVANRQDGKMHLEKYAPLIVQRADEITELVSAYLELFPGSPENPKSKFPNALKRAVSLCFPKFDEYQFAKYSRKTKVSFKDVIRICHPGTPGEILKKIIAGTLAVPKTWETQISTRGNKPEVWEELIKENKLPYFATIRNLRNLLTTGDNGISDDALDKVIAYISNERAVKKSKMLPFRFFQAYHTLKGQYTSWTDDVSHPRMSDVLDALEDACKISFGNIPHMSGTTVIACDVSASMQYPISDKSTLQLFDIGLLLGSASHKFTDKSFVGMFGNIYDEIALSKRSSGIIHNVMDMRSREGEVGYSTNGYTVIDHYLDQSTHVDRFLFFTDCQLWDSYRGGDTIRASMERYRSRVNPNAHVYMFDLSGYGLATFPEQDKKVVNIGGWSEKILQFIQLNEVNPKAQINHIKRTY